MNERLEDVLSLVEKAIRVVFYIGTGVYLGAKAAVVIPQSNIYPHWLTGPAILICMLGSFLLCIKTLREPSPRQLRAEREKAEKTERLLKYWMPEDK